jgi:hypothetical protein
MVAIAGTDVLILNMVRRGRASDASIGCDPTLSVGAISITRNNYRGCHGREEFPDLRYGHRTFRALLRSRIDEAQRPLLQFDLRCREVRLGPSLVRPLLGSLGCASQKNRAVNVGFRDGCDGRGRPLLGAELPAWPHASMDRGLTHSIPSAQAAESDDRPLT